MNRRDILKVLGAMPIAGALGGCGRAYSAPKPNPAKETQVHTLQILLEGAFAVVLQKQSQKLTAFVPLPDPTKKDLAHFFSFNDPGSRKYPDEKSKGYRFELSAEGLHKYASPEPAPYVNPGFNDFSAEVDRWRLPPSLVVLDLPFPRSINFSGRPLNVRFGKNALKPTGLMPTNYILEYRVDNASKVQLRCDHPEMHCSPSPHCPPGVFRYYFGVGPTMSDVKGRQGHAVAFFNFLMATVFPDLKEKYELEEIEPSDYEEPGGGGTAYPASLNLAAGPSPAMIPAIFGGQTPRPRFLPVASLVDCQSGGFLGSTSKPPTG